MGTIAEKLTYLNETKTAIKDALTAKGAAVSDTDTFRSYADKIESIETGGSSSGGDSVAGITISNLISLDDNGNLTYGSVDTFTCTATSIKNACTLAYCSYRNTTLTSVSFPNLTSSSFNSYTSQFNNMLKGVTGCTVHFPSNLESTLSSWSSVTAGFGGTDTTVLYDLDATE